MLLFIDTETYSAAPLKYGVYKYAEEVEVMLFAYAIDDQPPKVWDRTADLNCPPELQDAFHKAEKICVHNAAFDIPVIASAMGTDIPIERVHCTMAQALAHSLPGGLGLLCEILGVASDQAKDKDGRRLINRFCKPQGKNSKIERATRETHPEDWQKFVDYAKLDISAMRQVYKKLPTWNFSGRELSLWHLDQRINRRGFSVDRSLALGAIAAIGERRADLAADCQSITDGAVQDTTQRDVLLRYILREHGVTLPDMQASTLERRLNDPELPLEVRELLAIRLQATTTSTAKYQTLINAVSKDGRLRGTTQFCGASRTGRWAGRVVQPQNLPSKGLLAADDIAIAISAFKTGCADLVVENVMHAASSCIRSCIVASPGKKLVVADLSNIEGRFAAWVAGEAWKVQAFRDFDAGTGPDLYRLAYARAFKKQPDEVNDEQRQIGKTMELMLQYGGGVGAFVTGAANLGIDLDHMAVTARAEIPRDVLQAAERAWDWAVSEKRTLGLPKDVYVICDALKRLWRTAHPAITGFWRELEDAAVTAIQNPNTLIACGKVSFKRQGGWLRLVLPSGRSLCYPSPRFEEGKLSYMGVDQYTRKWRRIHTYSGKIFENLCQAGSRDVMAHNMPEIEKKGYQILFTCHDEIVSEAPSTSAYDVDGLVELLAANPEWAVDLPLAAKGYEGQAYKKG